MSAAEDLEFELEALLATYGEDAVHVQHQSSTHHTGCAGSHIVEVPVAPRSDVDCEQYVAALLVLTLDPSYPTQPPSVQLRDAKGLPDQHLAELQAALQREAQSMAGEMQLGHLVESAIELLSAANQPFGACTICLEPLTGDPSSSTTPNSAASVRAVSSSSSKDVGRPALQVVRLPCYHCYHAACFGPWWHWQQRRLAQRERQLWSEYKSMAPLKLEEESIRQEAVSVVGGGTADNAQAENGAGECAYVLPCPACRAEVAPASLVHIWQQLQAVTAESWSGGGGRAAWSELPPQQRQQLQAMQRRHAAVMRRQQQCGGLVEASHSVSLSDLQQAGTASANAAAAAAAAAAATGLAADARAVSGPPLAAPGPTSSGVAGESGAHQASEARRGGRGGRLPPAGGRGGRMRGGRAEGGTACCGGDNGSGRGRGRKGSQQRQPSAAAVPGSAAAAAVAAAAPGAAAGAAAAAASLKALHIDRPAGQQQRRPSAGRGRGRGRGSSSLASSAGLAPAPSS